MDGVGAICQMCSELYRLVLNVWIVFWPELKSRLSTLAWVYVSTVRMFFYLCLSPLVVIVGVLGVPVWLLERGIALADLILARMD